MSQGSAESGHHCTDEINLLNATELSALQWLHGQFYVCFITLKKSITNVFIDPQPRSGHVLEAADGSEKSRG